MEIDINDLAKVQGIGPKTLERVRELVNYENGYRSKFDPSLYMKIKRGLNLGDCLKLMNGIPNCYVDMVLADLPYGTTNQNKWDNVISFDNLWAHYNRITKSSSPIVLTASQPFTTDIVNSNRALFRYEWIWRKEAGTGFLNSKKMPLKDHENICVFYRDLPTYNPQMREGDPYTIEKGHHGTNWGKDSAEKVVTINEGERYPLTVLEFNRPSTKLHPTQKPVELFEYLIKTYTNEGDLVLDNTAGVYTTAIACINTNRRYICIEKGEKYHEMGSKWVELVEEGIDYKEAMKQVKKEFEQ